MRFGAPLIRGNAIGMTAMAGLLAACVGGESTAADPGVDDKGNPVAQSATGDDDPGSDGQDAGGPGARAVSPSLIKVTWQPNSETDIAGYRVYRGGTVVATIGHPTTTYSDRNVLPAKTYAYNVTAFDIAGNESGFSTTFRATTPPSNLPTLSFAADVFPILQSQCASCHAAFAMVSTAYTRLTSMGSGPCAGRRVAIPGNALRSLLFQKVTGSQECGEAPPSGPLASDQANIIGAWINQGGLDN